VVFGCCLFFIYEALLKSIYQYLKRPFSIYKYLNSAYSIYQHLKTYLPTLKAIYQYLNNACPCYLRILKAESIYENLKRTPPPPIYQYLNKKNANAKKINEIQTYWTSIQTAAADILDLDPNRRR